MGDLFTNLSKCDINQAIIKLEQHHEDNWKDVVNNKPELRKYKKIKTSLDPANYLTWNLQKSERSLFAQFRCGILQLRVESGRFCNLELGQRICHMCDNAIEDEFLEKNCIHHFITYPMILWIYLMVKNLFIC